MYFFSQDITKRPQLKKVDRSQIKDRSAPIVGGSSSGGGGSGGNSGPSGGSGAGPRPGGHANPFAEAAEKARLAKTQPLGMFHLKTNHL